jgi:hypothetical protein
MQPLVLDCTFKVKIVLWFVGNCQKLETIGALAKQKYLNKVGTSERTKAVIEPRLSDQWFLKMEDLSKTSHPISFG